MPTYRITQDGSAIVCLRCQSISYHAEDVRQLYCAHCHRFHQRHPDPLAPALSHMLDGLPLRTPPSADMVRQIAEQLRLSVRYGQHDEEESDGAAICISPTLALTIARALEWAAQHMSNSVCEP